MKLQMVELPYMGVESKGYVLPPLLSCLVKFRSADAQGTSCGRKFEGIIRVATALIILYSYL
jgi:hypothetical protein